MRLMAILISMLLLASCQKSDLSGYKTDTEKPELSNSDSADVPQSELEAPSPAATDEEIARLKEAHAAVESALREEIARQQATLKKYESGTMSVTLEEPILFDSGSNKVNEAGSAMLRKVAKGLAVAPGSAIRIVGHTDSFPITDPALKARFADNWELSAARAAAVARVFIWGGKVDPKRIRIVGRSHTDPVADNGTEEGRQKNRRIEIYITAN